MNGRSELILGTAGHIDHGKTSLVRRLTGVDTDRLPAEKARGMTIDLGFAPLDLGERRIGLIDVPGHERFIRNMLAGATGIDMALLVIAADDSVMPQTREHLELLCLLGVSRGLVALTKCDLVEASWRDLVKEEVRGFLAGTFLESAEILEVSSHNGAGIEALRAAICELSGQICPRIDPGPFRLAVDRSFTVEGHGTVVTGTVASGSLTVGEEIEWLPCRRTLRVRGLQTHDRRVERVVQGARAAINLTGVHHSEIGRGQVLASPDYLIPSQRLLVELRLASSSRSSIEHGCEYRLHIGTLDVATRVTLLGGAREVTSGQFVPALLETNAPVSAVYGEAFVLRRESPAATLGGGKVLQPVAARFRRKDPDFFTRIDRMRSPEPARRLLDSLQDHGLSGWSEMSLCRETGVPFDQIAAHVDRLKITGELIDIAFGTRRSITLACGFVHELETRIVVNLGRLHAESPRQSGILRARVESSMAYLDHPALVSSLLDRLVARGDLNNVGRGVAVNGFQPKLSQGERKLKAEIAKAFRDGGVNPPGPGQWMTKANTRGDAVPELLALLCVEEQLVAISPEIYLDFEVAGELRSSVAQQFQGDVTFTMAELRDLIGTSRKYAVPIGEYLDRIGLTYREGDLRRLKPQTERQT